MKASNQRQLNIRSDEAYEIAHELAAKRGKSATEIVVTALRSLKGARTIPSTKVTPEEAEANYRMIMEGVREANRKFPNDLSSDHDYLYDEHGLPK